MRRAVAVLAAVLVPLAVSPSTPAAERGSGCTDEPQEVERTLAAMTRERLDAIAPGRWSVWEEQLADDAIYSAEDGRVLTKADLKAELRPLPAGYEGRIEPTELLLRRHGDLAVLSHLDLETLVLHGQRVEDRYRTTDVYLCRGGAWKLVASHVLALESDPPAVALDAAVLRRYAGTYALSPSATYTVTVEGGRLMGQRSGGRKGELLAEAEGVFFVAGQPGRKLFPADGTGRVTRLVDRRRGQDLVWTRAQER
jgi:hypothetical protein